MGPDERCQGAACEEETPATPEPVENRPGLPEIAYRIGTFASFRQAMIDAIPKQNVALDGSYLARDDAEIRPLEGWTSREEDDYGIAFLTMWAYLADILTFYQERIANEAFLRTATQEEALRRLAALLGYEPSPGLAATALLAFTLDEGMDVDVPEGLLVQSAPLKEGEKPQKFETSTDLAARAELNRFRVYPQPAEAFALREGGTHATVASDVSHLAPGDQLVFFTRKFAKSGSGGKTADLPKGAKALAEAVGDAVFSGGVSDIVDYLSENPKAAQATSIALSASTTTAQALEILEKLASKAKSTKQVASTGKKATTEALKVATGAIESDDEPLHVEDKKVKDVRSEDWRTVLEWEPAIRADFTVRSKAYKWKRKLHLFGFDAPVQVLVASIKAGGSGSDSDILEASIEAVTYNHKAGRAIDLDNVYDDLKENSKLLVVCPSKGVAVVATVTGLEQVEAKTGPSSTVPALQRTITRASTREYVPAFDMRSTVVYELEGDAIDFWGFEYAETIAGDAVYLPLVELGLDADEALAFLENGREIVLADGTGAAHAASVTGASVENDHLRIEITPAIEAEEALDASNAEAYANVVEATHGETVEELLGSGDASATYQSFTLKKSPVTFVPEAGAPGGAGSTLKVYVDGLLWERVPSLHESAPDARAYALSVDEEGVVTIEFGDGIHGSRLPTGRDNVVAVYRVGIGTAGNVGATAIRTLRDKILGLKAVTNLLAASGGAEGESQEDVRSNAPNTVRTFGRIVSLTDFEDAAREYAGVAKARASVEWKGERQIVELTVAGDDGTELDDATLANLRADLDARRDPQQRFAIVAHDEVFVEIEVAVKVDPAYVAEEVLENARAALVEHFAFESRDLGQAVHLSEIYRVLHDVAGVAGADVDTLRFKDEALRERHEARGSLQNRLRLLAREIAALDAESIDEDLSVTQWEDSE